MSVNVTIRHTEVLSDERYTLKKVRFERINSKGRRQEQELEVYDRGNAATILLYNLQKRTVVMTRQFRLPTFLNGNPSGMMIECCAGLMDDDTPEDCVKREAQEETGYAPLEVTKIFEAYMSAGGVTELLYFFTGCYDENHKVSEGGGLADEKEDIEVMELPFDRCLSMIESGEIRDAKTIMLLQYALIHGIMEKQI